MITRYATWILCALLVAPVAMAQNEEGKKGRGQGKGAQSATATLLKQIAAATLTEEQTAKVKELGKKAEDEIKKLQSEAKLTPALLKKRREAAAALEDSEKKGKQRAQAIDAAAGINEAQAAALTKANALRLKLKQDAVKLLSDEQKAKLPAEFMASLAGPKGKAQGAESKGAKPSKKKAQANS